MNTLYEKTGLNIWHLGLILLPYCIFLFNFLSSPGYFNGFLTYAIPLSPGTTCPLAALLIAPVVFGADGLSAINRRKSEIRRSPSAFPYCEFNGAHIDSAIGPCDTDDHKRSKVLEVGTDRSADTRIQHQCRCSLQRSILAPPLIIDCICVPKKTYG